MSAVPSRITTNWSIEEFDFLGDHWESAASILALAIFMGRTASSIQTQASRRGLPARTGILEITRLRWDQDKLDELDRVVEKHRLADGRIPIVDVAAELGRTIDAVGMRLGLFKHQPSALKAVIYIPDSLIEDVLQKRTAGADDHNHDDDDFGDFNYEDLMPKKNTAMRSCLSCTRPFYSEGFGNRICDPCKKKTG